MKIDKKEQAEYFNVEKNRYDSTLIARPPLHTRLEQEALYAGLTVQPDKKGYVIDFGAGSGRTTIPLLEKGYSVCSIDISQKSLDSIVETAKRRNLKSPKTAHSFDSLQDASCVIGTDILHHVDMDEYLPAMYKSLRSGGQILFSEPNALNISWYLYLPVFYSWSVEKGVMTCSYFNLKKQLKKYGFTDIKITGLGALPRPFFNFSEALCRVNDRAGNVPGIRIFSYRYIISAFKR